MNNLINCPMCHKEVSPNAKSCPHCGEPLRDVRVTYTVKEEKKGLGFWGVVLAIIVAVIIMSLC